MKKRLFILLGVIAVVGLAGVLFPWRTGPNYRGRTVAEWALQSASPEVPAREAAAAAFRALGTNAVPGLIRLLECDDAYWRRRLWAAAPTWPAPLRRLAVRAAGTPQAPRLHLAAARSVAVLGPPAAGAIPALVKVVYGADAQARFEAALALGQIGKSAVPALAAALDHRDREVRHVALCALGVGRPADMSVAIPAMARAVSDADEGVRVAAMKTFEKLGPTLLAPLTNAMSSGDQPTRLGAAMALTSIQASRSEAAAPLLGLAQDPEAAARLRALQGLSRLGIPDAAAIRAYVAALKDADPEVRLAAIQGLNQAHWQAGPAVAALTDCLGDESPKIREWATRVLGALGEPAASSPSVMEGLTRRLEDPEMAVRAAASEALGKLK